MVPLMPVTLFTTQSVQGWRGRLVHPDGTTLYTTTAYASEEECAADASATAVDRCYFIVDVGGSAE